MKSPDIDELIAELDSDESNVADDAQHDLGSIGADAVEPVLRALPKLRVYGQRCVLDLLTSWPAQLLLDARRPTVAEVVIPLLSSEDEVVRCWSAEALAHVGAVEAVPELRRALERSKQARTPLDWYEPVTLRRTLTALGDRLPVVPARLRELELDDERLSSCWPAERLAELVEALAAEGQALLGFGAWKRRPEGLRGKSTPSFEVETEGPWPEVVARARAAALEAIASWRHPPNTVVTLDWIDESDR
ncbi:MAG: HEAT repeat domain-containing protein [Planctomycetota bacterium]